MNEYNLKMNEATGKVRYVMVQKGGNVQGETSLEGALWMLKRGKAHTSDEVEGYPLTADGVYFFETEVTGAANARETAQCAVFSELGPVRPNIMEQGTGENGEATAEAETDHAEDVDVEIGADGLPLLAGDGTKRRRRRVKDRVCE